MNAEQQRQNPIARFWWSIISLVASVLRWIGFNVTWGQRAEEADNPSASALKAKEEELKSFLAELEQKEQRIVDRYGDEFLLAAERGDVHFFELYLSFGMPVNHHHPKTGETALHIAARRRARRIVRSLIETGKSDFSKGIIRAAWLQSYHISTAEMPLLRNFLG